jgi:tRNA (pseudouridine54-N1)-methyltransferase
MREFIYFSRTARTSGNFKDLMKAGRLDIACHVVIAAFFLSHKLRENIKLHLVFYGPPDPPKHLELNSSERMKEFLSKKDVSGLIKRMLYKYKKYQKTEPFPSCFIEKKSLLSLIRELQQENKKIYILDPKGTPLRKAKIEKNSVFLLGDHKGLPQKEKKRISKTSEKISIGPKTYFASHTLVVLQNELDIRNL